MSFCGYYNLLDEVGGFTILKMDESNENGHDTALPINILNLRKSLVTSRAMLRRSNSTPATQLMRYHWVPISGGDSSILSRCHSLPWRDVDDSDWCDALVVVRGNDDDGWKEVVDVAPRNRAAAASFMVLLLLHEKRYVGLVSHFCGSEPRSSEMIEWRWCLYV